MASTTATSSAGRTASTMSNSQSHSTTAAAAAGRPRGGPNGVNNKSKSHNDQKSANVLPLKETNTPDKHAHDRLLFLVANFVGRPAKVTVKNGHQFTGIFSGSFFEQTDSHYVLKMTRKLQTDTSSKANGAEEQSDEYVGYGADHVMTFDIKDVVDLDVTEVSTEVSSSNLPNGTSSGFRTDTDISGNGVVRERELKRWEPSSEASIDLSLSASGNGAWDQFETNERMYGLKTNYDENFYTTSIDRSHPAYKEKAARAEKLAREIEGTSSTNAHIAEERGQTSERDGNLDEEDKYSGVRREFSPLVSTQNRYTPPARRAPTGQTTVAGAPVDPAIISAQLVRPDSSVSRSFKSPTPASGITAPSQLKENVVPIAETTESSKTTTQSSEGDAKPQPKPTTTLRQAETTKSELHVPNKSDTTPKPPTITVNNGTTNVEKKVLNDFKEFAMHEKMRMAERGRENARNNARKEYEMKLNDLKRFASSFKLKSAVPEDMLGILAKDKHKQLEIVEKSQKQQKEAEQARVSSPATAVGSPVTVRPESTVASPSGLNENKPSRSGQFSPAAAVKGPQTLPSSSRAGPGHLGQRLMAQQQYRDRPPFGQQSQMEPRALSNGTSAINTELRSSRPGSVASPMSAASQRFNVQAMEFKPNPAASAFSPRGAKDEGVVSPVNVKGPAVSRSPMKASFLRNRRPCAEGDRLSIKDDFNPITRMKLEGEKDDAAKKFAANGGIPQAYRTGPTWDVAEVNKEKTYAEAFEKVIPVPVASPGNGLMAHQHQLPSHLQPGQHVPQVMIPQQMPLHVQQQFAQGRGDHHFDEHRMHVSSSNSSVFPSPRFQQPMLAFQPSQMMSHMQPGFAQPVGQFTIGSNGQPVPQLRQFSGTQQFQGGHLGSQPMMLNHSSGGTYMGMPMPQSPMYAQGQNGVFPGQGNVVHNGFSSPRMAPPMMHQGSQQGQPNQPYMYLNPQQVFLQQQQQQQQHPGQMQQGRPGMPMMAQNFSGSPHLQQHFPQHRGNSYNGNLNQQQMGPNHNAQHQVQNPVAPTNHNESADVK